MQCTFKCRADAVGAAADSSVELRRAEALLSAERERGRMLDARLADLESVRQKFLGQADAAATALRAAEAAAVEKGRAAAYAEAGLQTAQGRARVLEAQLQEAHEAAAEMQRQAQDAEGEHGSAASSAARESASLSATLRAARARCGPAFNHNQAQCQLFVTHNATAC
jgi:DNA repair exonuclease SbcCD ATPase subunit